MLIPEPNFIENWKSRLIAERFKPEGTDRFYLFLAFRQIDDGTEYPPIVDTYTVVILSERGGVTNVNIGTFPQDLLEILEKEPDIIVNQKLYDSLERYIREKRMVIKWS